MKCVCALQYFFVHNIFWGGVKYEAMCFWQDSRGAFASYTTLDLLIQSRFWLIWTLDSQSFQMCDDVHDVFLRQGRDGDMIESQHPLGFAVMWHKCQAGADGRLCLCVCVRRLCGEQIFVRMYWIRLIVLCCNRGKTDPGAAGGFCWGSWRSLCPGRGGRRGRWRPLRETTSADTSGDTNTTPLLTLQYITKSQLSNSVLSLNSVN